jgi:ribulose-phosphate 3-epimerase
VAAVLAPSILSADFAQLGAQVRAVEAGGAALIHIDVMDGHFVPNITVGPVVTAAVRKVTRLPLDCHLMIEEPARYAEAFVEAGAEMVSIHVDASWARRPAWF